MQPEHECRMCLFFSVPLYFKLARLTLIQSNGVSVASASASRLSLRASHFYLFSLTHKRSKRARINSKDVPIMLFDNYIRARSVDMREESCIKRRVHNKLSYIFSKYSAIFWLRAANGPASLFSHIDKHSPMQLIE